eukprot:3129820-Rhodomonas_salina.1
MTHPIGIRPPDPCVLVFAVDLTEDERVVRGLCEPRHPGTAPTPDAPTSSVNTMRSQREKESERERP